MRGRDCDEPERLEDHALLSLKGDRMVMTRRRQSPLAIDF